MVDYKYYEDEEFNIADGNVIIDITGDLGGKQPVMITCVKGMLYVEIEVNAETGFGEKITIAATKTLEASKILRLRVSARRDNTAYEIYAGLNEASLKNAVTGECNGAFPVNVQDQTSPPVLVYLNKNIGSTTLAAIFSIDDCDIVLASVAGITVGDYVGVFNTTSNRYYVGNVLSIDVPTSTVTMDTPSDFDFQIGDMLKYGTKDMNIDGSVTKQIFGLRADPSLALTVDVTRIILHITDQTSMDDAKFGGISALTNGVVLRRKNGVYQNLFNVKSNGEIGELAYDKTYDSKAPSGFYGFSSRLTFAGQSKMGVVIRLAPEDDLQLIIQDDLTGLDSFRIMVEGHIVTD